jgi:hypothetical protein
MLTGRLDIDNTALMKKCLDTSTDNSIASLKESNTSFIGIVESYEESRINPASNPHLWPEFSQVMDHLKTLIDPNQIMFSWYNITLNGGVMKSHNHPSAGDSVFIYYVNCNSSHPPLEILINNKWTKHNCETGSWLLFSKDTYHRAGINFGSSDRISIVINIDKPSE